MTAAGATIPSDADLLCERCGYILNGLPDSGNCPECGVAVAFSSASGRILPDWETAGAFWRTSRRVIFQPTDFYRTLRTRVSTEQHRRARRFAIRHWFLSAFLIALAGWLHYRLTQTLPLPARPGAALGWMLGWVAIVTLLVGLAMMGLTHLATHLTAWEAGWRGYRLPRPVVLRGLYYHAAHVLPVAAVVLGVVLTYRILWTLGVTGYEGLVVYLFVLAAACVAGAIYLFWTYWIGMRNMLYANG